MTPVDLAIVVLLGLGAASIVVAVAGMALSSEVFAMLLYGSIPSGFAAAAIASAAALSQPPGVASLQMLALFSALVISGAVGGHRIAAAAAARKQSRRTATDTTRGRLPRLFAKLPVIGPRR